MLSRTASTRGLAVCFNRLLKSETFGAYTYGPDSQKKIKIVAKGSPMTDEQPTARSTKRKACVLSSFVKLALGCSSAIGETLATIFILEAVQDSIQGRVS